MEETSYIIRHKFEVGKRNMKKSQDWEVWAGAGGNSFAHLQYCLDNINIACHN